MKILNHIHRKCCRTSNFKIWVDGLRDHTCDIQNYVSSIAQYCQFNCCNFKFYVHYIVINSSYCYKEILYAIYPN